MQTFAKTVLRVRFLMLCRTSLHVLPAIQRRSLTTAHVKHVLKDKFQTPIKQSVKFQKVSTYINVVMFLKSRLRSINNQVSKNKKDQEMVFCYQNCSNDREKLLKFEAEGQEFARFLRSLEQFIQTVKVQNNFWW